jgi:hypothetical protein
VFCVPAATHAFCFAATVALVESGGSNQAVIKVKCDLAAALQHPVLRVTC